MELNTSSTFLVRHNFSHRTVIYSISFIHAFGRPIHSSLEGKGSEFDAVCLRFIKKREEVGNIKYRMVLED